MDASFVRICAVPVLPPRITDGLAAACEPFGRMQVAAPADPDLDCTVTELRVTGDAPAALRAAGGALAPSAPAHLLSFFVQRDGQADSGTEAALSNALSSALDTAVYAARVAGPASEWIERHPMSFGVDGFAIRADAPATARPQGRGRGAALEFGPPSILMKVTLHGVPASALRRMCDALGSARGGLLHLGAYPAISAGSGAPLIVLECSDAAKSPPARGIELLEIEAARWGGAVAAVKLLSHIPLAALVGTLAVRMHLPVAQSQIIETHLAQS